MNVWAFATRPVVREPLATEQVVQSLDNAARADVEIAYGVGTLPQGGDPPWPPGQGKD